MMNKLYRIRFFTKYSNKLYTLDEATTRMVELSLIYGADNIEIIKADDIRGLDGGDF